MRIIYIILAIFLLVSCENIIDTKSIKLESQGAYSQLFSKKYTYGGVFQNIKGENFIKFYLNDKEELIYLLNITSNDLVLNKINLSNKLIPVSYEVGDKTYTSNLKMLKRMNIIKKLGFHNSQVNPIIGYDYQINKNHFFSVVISNWNEGGGFRYHYLVESTINKINLLKIIISNKQYSPEYVDIVAPHNNSKTKSILYIPRENPEVIVQYNTVEKTGCLMKVPFEMPLIDIIPGSEYVILYDSYPQNEFTYILKLFN